MKRIGVAGCGSMGQPMAECLLAAGFDVLGFDVRPAAEFGDFAQYMTSDASELGQCDCVISVVRDAAETEQLCFTDQAIFAAPPCPPCFIVSSTLAPRSVHELRARLPAETTLIDAPMSGAPHRARAAALTFMLGGERESLERLRPLFAAMGSTQFHLGPLGAGMTVKVLNNYCAAASVVAARRSMELAASNGVAHDTLLAVMRASSGNNWYVENLADIDWAREGYDPRNTIGIVHKDVTCALDLAGYDKTLLDEALLDSLRNLRPL